MNKLLSSLSGAIILLLACSSINPEPALIKKQKRIPPPRFAVISDVHFNANNAPAKVTRALKNLVSKDIDAIFVVGDLTDYGQDGQYVAFKAVFNNTSIIPASVKKYYMTGNHDCYTQGFMERFTAQLGQPFDQYIELNDYPFITIGSSGTPNSGSGCYSAEQKVFLSEKLAAAAVKYPGKPIFVFMHVAPSNTAYGTNSNDGNWSSPNMNDVLSQYPQAIVFSGHSHYPLGDPRSIWQGTFTAINDGSTAYSEVEPGMLTDGIHPANNHDVTEGVIVSIEGDGDVLVERYDTNRDEKILPDWTISAPHDGTAFHYKDKTNTVAPVFASSAKPVVSNITATGCTVTWPQAMDNEVVFRYKVETSPATATINLFSGFYLNSAMPEQLSRNLIGLTAGAQYTINVIAVDSYGNQSEAIVSETFVAE